MSIGTGARNLLIEAGALKKGHFQLSSGLHSDEYCQCATLFEQPAVAARMASLLPESVTLEMAVDVVLTPAIGGILWGYEVARAIRVRSIFAERDPGGPFKLRRGFVLYPGEKVLLAEDVITTGKSVLELVPLVEAAGAKVVGFVTIADRSQGKFQPTEPLIALARLDFATHLPGDCPLCAAKVPLDKPGSRTEARPNA